MDRTDEPLPFSGAAAQRVTCHRCKRVVDRADAIDMRRLLDKPMTEPWRCRPCFREPQATDQHAA